MFRRAASPPRLHRRGALRLIALAAAASAAGGLLAGCDQGDSPPPLPAADELTAIHNAVARRDIPAHLNPRGYDITSLVHETARKSAELTGKVTGLELEVLISALGDHDVGIISRHLPEMQSLIDGVVTMAADGPKQTGVGIEEHYTTVANTLASLIFHQVKAEFLKDALRLVRQGITPYPPEALESTRKDWQAATEVVGGGDPQLVLIARAAAVTGAANPLTLAQSLYAQARNGKMTTPLSERLVIVREMLDAGAGASALDLSMFKDPRTTEIWRKLAGAAADSPDYAFRLLQFFQSRQATADAIQGLLVFEKEGPRDP